MTAARHAPAHQPLRVDWRAVRSMLADIAEALWMTVCATFWSFVAAIVLGLLAFGFKQNGQWAAGVLTIGIGFALIVFVLIEWTRRQQMTTPRPGNGSCPWCSRDRVRITTRVVGHPRPGIVTLVDSKGVDVCGDCAPDVIDTALREHQFSSLPVEVLPLKQAALVPVNEVSDEDRREIAHEVTEDRTRDAAGLE